MSLEWNKLYKLGTDVAGFMFFHPKRLEHRKKDPIDWWANDFREEFLAGRLAAFCTGSDGTFTMKFVRRPLTDIENQALAAQACFRYDVRDDRLFWDNSGNLPSEDQMSNAEDDPEGWLEIPNGRYRIILNALDWYSLPDAVRVAEENISHYLVQFEETESFEDVPVPKDLPLLIASKRRHAK